MLIIISMFVMMTLAVGVLVIYNTSQNRILKEVEDAHLKEIQFKNKLLSNSIEVQERERSRIAKDLHDDIGSKLSIVNLNLNLLKVNLTTNDQTEILLDQIETTLTESITRTRDISHNLYPPILEKFGIQSALESLAKQVTRTGILKVNLDIAHPWKAMDKASELHIYRIFQELIHNTVKHAEAQNVWIKSESIEDKLLLNYTDDGVGLASNGSTNLGLGMSSIQTRVGLLNAQMNIEQAGSKGFQVAFEI